METLIHRASNLLSFMTPEEASQHLVESGVSGEEAFLAVKAARILTSGNS